MGETMEYDPFGGLLAPWQNAQRPMAAVVRWGNFPSYGQTLVEHNNSIPYVLMWVQSKLGKNLGIDWLLLHQAVLVHDQGEPISGGDEHVDNKTADKEQREYEAFVALLASSESSYRQLLTRAFLLQYVRKPQWWSSLSESDQLSMKALAHGYKHEAQVFEMVERLDYLASAVVGARHGVHNDKEAMIDHVLGNQVPKLDTLVDEWPPLSAVWSPDLRSMLLALKTTQL